MKRYFVFLLLFLCANLARAQFSGSGLGTAESPYLITNALNVEEIRNFQGIAGVQFRLMNDIDMSELIEDTYGDAGWNPIPNFQGELDGNGFTISGLFINRPIVEKVGFFSDLSKAFIHDLILVYSDNVIGDKYTGGLCAYSSESKIERCMIKGIEITGYYAGGFLGGSSSGIISECIVDFAQVNGVYCGGLVSSCSSCDILNNRVNTIVVAKHRTDRDYEVFCGGIVGYYSGGRKQLQYNLFEGKIITTSFKHLRGDGTSSSITSTTYGGGIIGLSSSSFSSVCSNVSICDTLFINGGGLNNYARIGKGEGLNDPTATNANRAYNKTVIKIGNECSYATDSKENGLSVGNILLKNANMYKSMGWDLDNVWSIDEGNTYPRLKWEVEKGLSRPTLTVKNNETIIGENDIISFLAEKVTTNLGGGVIYTYYQCIPNEPSIENTSSRTQQVIVTVTSQDYSHLKWAGIDGQNADMKESSESRTCQLERGASVPLKLHAVFSDQDFGSYSATVVVSCEDYSRTFLITFTNENPNKPICPTPVIDYSEGKLVFSCDVEGTPVYHVNITDPDVTSHVVSNELDIERTYTIEVYATAEGYQASDTTKLILCWIDTKISDSVEGIISEKGAPLKIRRDSGSLSISGVENNMLVSAYSIDGILLDSITSTSETVTLSIPNSIEVIVLKVGDSSIRIVLL